MPQSLYRSFNQQHDAGAALYMPLTALRENKIAFRKGQVGMINGAPGGGKSTLILNIIINTPKVPVLYLSPDSDIMTLGPRMVAIADKVPLSQVESELDKGGESRARVLEKTKQFSHIQWSFKTSPSFENIIEELEDYETVHGYFPEMIVLDNIRDVYSDEVGEGGEHQRFSATVDFFADLAESLNIAVVLLHHLKGQYENGDVPPPLSALLGNVSKQARMVLNLFDVSDSEMGIVPAKLSNGRAYRTASHWHTVLWNKETQVIT